MACSSGGSFSLKGSAFEGDDGPRIFSVIRSSCSASLEKRREERRRLLALLFREVMRRQISLMISSRERAIQHYLELNEKVHNIMHMLFE